MTLRQRVYEKTNGKCAYCGSEITIKGMQVDHIIPKGDWETCINSKTNIPIFLTHLSISDLNHIDNLNPACGPCNNRKSSLNLEFFRSELQDQLNRANQHSANYRMAKRYGQVVETPSDIVFYFEKISY